MQINVPNIGTQTIKRTTSDWIKLDTTTKKILSLITHESKNVFNHYIFCTKVFNKYKYIVYQKLLKSNAGDVNEKILENMELHYNVYSKHFPIILNNNKLIYAFIHEENPKVYHNNYDQLVIEFTDKCKNIDGLQFTKKHNDLVYDNIIKDILRSMYFHNYYETKSILVNHKKSNDLDAEFVKHVKSKKTIFDTDNYRTLLLEKNKNLTSEQNLMRRFASNQLKDCLLPNDVVINIMNKGFTAYSSRQALKRKGLKTGDIRFLPKNGHFVVPFYSHSFKVIGNKIRLAVGKNIEKYMSDNMDIKDTRFIYFNLPNNLQSKTNYRIKLVEIIPRYDGYRYKMNVVYDETVPVPKQYFPSSISADIGMVNLLTIYDPMGQPIIIKGSYLTSINRYFNMKIDRLKSYLPKNKKTSKQIRNLLIKHENILNYRMNKIVNLLYDKYKTKDTIIIGYNEGWKQEVHMGRDTNRVFYEIPYDRLIKKIESKFLGRIVIRIGEAFTSKCDALNLETIDYKPNNQYDGQRVHRGLYSSKTNKLINADLNGAINIMRLYYLANNIEFTQVTGINLGNPKIIKIDPKCLHDSL